MTRSNRSSPFWPLVAAVLAFALPEPRLAPAQQPRQPAPAQAAMPQEPDPAAAALEELPADVDMALIIRNAADLRRSPVGAGVTDYLAESGLLGKLQSPWSNLARRLGWTEDETLDRLLGRRVVYVFSSAQDPADTRWALLSDVTAETDRRLRERLEVSPRKIDKGHTIFVVEKGQFELTSHRRRDGTITIVLGPMGKGELFDTMVRALDRGAPGPLAGADLAAAARSAGPAEILLVLRPEARTPDAAPRPQAWSDYLLVAGRRADPAGRAWTSRVVLRDSVRRAALGDVPVTSDAPFAALERDALLTVVQTGSLENLLGRGFPGTDFLSFLTFSDAIRPLLRGRQVVSLRAVPSPPAERDAIAIASARTRPAAAAAPAPEPSRLALTLALETSDTRRLATDMDRTIAQFAQNLEVRFGGAQTPPHDFGGRIPQAPRVLPLELPENGAAAALGVEPVVLSWAYPAAPAPGEPDAGWWVFTVMPTALDAETGPSGVVRDHSAALAAPATQGRLGRWVWLGSARPAALERSLPAVIPDLNGFRSAMRRFDRLGLRLSITETGDIQGDLTLELTAGRALAEPASAPPPRR